MTPTELSDLLWAQVDRVAKHLLPNGKREGHEWVVGSTGGEAGKSLKVNLTGKKVWQDFASGEGGDLLDLWVAVQGCGLHQAMQEAKQFMGVRDEDHHFAAKQQKKFKRPDRKKVARYLTKSKQHVDYLASRGISAETVARFGITSGTVWDRDSEREYAALVFPYKRDGELLQVKRISIERPNGKKIIMAEGDCEPCLYGWEALPKEARAVILCEGEIDCLSFYQYSLPALSVPFGGGTGAKQQWIDFEYHNLDRFEEIWLALDNDEVGRAAAIEIAQRLGIHRCRLVTLPHKDINECLMQGVPMAEIDQCIERAEYFDPDELRGAREYLNDTWDAFYGEQQYLFKTPWTTLNPNFLFRGGELSIVNGVNGHGKTEIVGQIALEAMSQGVRACIASFELKPGVLLKRLTRQCTCTPKPPRLEFESAFNFYDDRLWVFGLTGNAKADRLLEIFDYAHRRYNVKLFVIDSLMKVVSGTDDYNGQKDFINALCDFKHRTGAHILLVTHARKTDAEDRPTGKMDVGGTGAITDLTDNLFIIWRNKLRERALKKLDDGAGHEQLADKERDAISLPGSLLLLEKQRNGEGWEGGIPLFLDNPSHQFVTSEGATPFNYMAQMPETEYQDEWASQNVTEY